MDRIEIYWGSDKNFEKAIENLDDVHFLVDVINHINKTDFKIEGIEGQKDPPMEVENLLIHTDDYGGVKEWALLGFSNNILRNLKVTIKNLWLCNPPVKIYKDIVKNFDKKIIKEQRGELGAVMVSRENFLWSPLDLRLQKARQPDSPL